MATAGDPPHTSQAAAEDPVASRPLPLRGAALVAALAVMIGFAGLVGYLIGEAGTDEVRWTRMAWLFSSVEAIAFGAAGALFGSSIQRQRAENAESAASRNADAAANGQALAAALKAEAPPDADETAGFQAFGSDDDAAAVARRHARLAQAMFPGGSST